MNKDSIPTESLIAIGLAWSFLGTRGWQSIVGIVITIIVIHYTGWKWSR